MQASKENVFIGAQVEKDGKKMTVVKINEKSLYLAPTPIENYRLLWKTRPAKETFKDFCRRNGFPMESYSGWEISETEAERGKAQKAAGKAGYSLSQAVRKEIEEEEKKKKIRLLVTFPTEKGTARILQKNGEDKYLVNCDGDYVLYNRTSGLSVKVGSAMSGLKSVDWERIK